MMELGQAYGDLIALMEHVPPLLEACTCDDIPVLRNLRFVNKEASRVALLGLRSYIVRLRGDATDTNISGARLLQGTHLTHLTLYLQLSGA